MVDMRPRSMPCYRSSTATTGVASAALLHDVAALAADYSLSISRGYVRRGTYLSIDIAARHRRGE